MTTQSPDNSFTPVRGVGVSSFPFLAPGFFVPIWNIMISCLFSISRFVLRIFPLELLDVDFYLAVVDVQNADRAKPLFVVQKRRAPGAHE